MSHLSKNLFSKINHKPGESTSNRSGQNVGDSILTMEDQPMTNNRVFSFMTSRTVAGTFLGLISILAVSCALLSTVPAYADDQASSDGPGHCTDPSACNTSAISVSVSSGANPSVNVAPTADGRFITSGKTTFSVSTTHAAGYKVTATSTALKDSTNTISTLTLPSGTSGITADDYGDNDYASTNNLNNTWGYLPSNLCTTSGATTTCAANTLYLPAPISATQTLDEVSSATNNTYDINIGTRVTTDTAQGAYATTFTVAVVGNATPYAITYNKNTTDTVSNMPTNHTTSDTGASGETVTLATNTPTRIGYTFNGWCTVTPTTSGGVDSCNGTKYSAGGSWTINQTAITNSLTLYAMWNRASYSVKVNFAGSGVSSVSFAASGYTTRTVSSSGGTASLMYGVRYTVTMSFSSTSYAFSSWALNSSSYGALSSTSTNPTYFTPNTSSASAIITATGKSNFCGTHTCIQDFTKADCQSLASSANYTVYDARDEKSYTVRYINGACWMTQNLRYLGDTGSTSGSMIMKSATSNISADKTVTYYELKGTQGSSSSGKCYGYNTSGNGYSNACTHTADATDVSEAGSSACGGSTCTTDQLGVWYNYAAASARTITGTSNSNADSYSVCPKNWTLPSYSTDGTVAGNIYGLRTSYSSANATAFSPLYGGRYLQGSHRDAGTYGYWWSATAYNAYDRYSLYYNSGSLVTGNLTRFCGYYVRCVRT